MRHASQSAELHRMMAAAAFQNTPLRAEYGELDQYDPTLHQGRFVLPMVLDDNDEPSLTGWLPIGSTFVGTGYGMQFPPPDEGMQALIVYVDHQGFSPVAAILMYNSIDTPPFPDGRTFGWKDKQGNKITTTLDGPVPGDGVGGVKIQAVAYIEISTTGGNSIIIDDNAGTITIETVTGNVFTLDDDPKITLQTAGGQIVEANDALKTLKLTTPGGLHTIMNDTEKTISHVLPAGGAVGIGALAETLPTVQQLMAHADIAQFQVDLKSGRLDDLTKFATAMIAAGVPSAGAVLGELATLIDIPVAVGSNAIKAIASI